MALEIEDNDFGAHQIIGVKKDKFEMGYGWFVPRLHQNDVYSKSEG